MKSHNPAKFYVRVIYRDSRTSEIIKPNLPVTSVISQGKMLNYVIQVRTTNREEHMKFRVEVSGDFLIPYLYAKHCRVSDDCGFFDNKVVTDKSEFENDQLKYEESQVGKKEMIVPFICGKDTMSVVTNVNELVTEYVCLLNIGIFAHKAAPTGSLFSILIHDTSQRLVLPTNSWKRVNTHLEDDLRLQYNLHSSEFNELASVQLSFDVLYGTGNAYISRLNTAPCDLKDLLGTVALSKSGVHSLILSPAQLPEQKLGGPYYVCIRSTSRLSLTAGLFPQLSTSSKSTNPILAQAQELPPNEQLLTVMDSNQVVYFTFNQYLPKNSSETINIHLTPIKGNFRIFVSANGQVPNPKQPYWNVADDHLVIKTTDPSFMEHGKYVIGVQFESRSGEPVAGGSYKFLISHSLSERHINLRSGVPGSGTLQLDNRSSKSVFYQLEIPLNASSFTFLKSTYETFVTSYISFNPQNGYPTRAGTDILVLPAGVTGVHLKSSQIREFREKQKLANKELTHIVAYVSLVSISPAKYWIQYIVDDEPFTVPENGPIQLPTFGAGSRMNLVYHITTNKEMELEARPIFHPLKVFAIVVPETAAHNTPFPTKASANNETLTLDTMYSKVLQIPASKDQHSVLLITLEPHFDVFSIFQGALMNAGLGFYRNGYLEVGNNEKHLAPGSTRHETVYFAQTKYFRVHHSPRHLNIVIDVKTLHGYVEVYISKGNQLPGESNHILHRVCGGDEIITVDKSHMKATDVLAGDYIIGVRGLSTFGSGSTFSIMYRSENLEVFTLEMGSPTEFHVKLDQVQYLELPNDGIMAPIEIAYRSRHAKLSLFVLPYTGVEKDMPMPSQEHFAWSSSMSSEGGFGRFYLDPKSSSYCMLCTYIIRVQTDMNDAVEILATKKSTFSKTVLREGRDYIGYLDKNQNDSYIMTVPYNESAFNLEVKVIKGNVTVIYSLDANFNHSENTKVIQEKTKDEFFNINFGTLSTFFRSILHKTLARYIKVIGQEDSSEYVLTLVSDEMVSQLKPLETRHSILGIGITHYYYFKTDTATPGDLSFHLRNVLHGDNQVDFNQFVQKIPLLVKIFHSPDFKDVQDRKFDYKLDSTNEMFQRELRSEFRTRAGYTIVRVKNEFSYPIQYSLLLSLNHVMKLSAKHDVPDHIVGHLKRKYLISNQLGGYQAQIKFRQCLGEVEANYAYIRTASVLSNDSASKDAEKWHTLVNHQVNNVYIPTRDNTDIILAVDNAESSSGREPTSVYLVNMEVHKDGNFDTGLDLSSVVIGDIQQNGEVDIFTDSDQAVKFQPVMFQADFAKAHSEYKVFINYTLFMSTKAEMMRFMKNCDTYKIGTAERLLETKNRYSFSTQEYYSLQNYADRTYNPRLMIKPHTLSFGGFYHGVVVAEVKFWKASDDRSFPRAENLRVYYNEFTFEPADFSVALVFMLTFLGIGVVAVLIYFLMKYKVFHGLKHKNFVQNILREFDEEQVGNNLVMEIMDFKKQKAQRVASDMSLQSADNTLDESMISSRDTAQQQTTTLTPEQSTELELSNTSAHN